MEAKTVVKTVALNATVGPYLYAGRQIVGLGKTLGWAGRTVRDTIRANRPENEHGADDPDIIAARQISDGSQRFAFLAQHLNLTPEKLAMHAAYARRTQQVFYLLGLAVFFLCTGMGFQAAMAGEIPFGLLWLAMAFTGSGMCFVFMTKWAKKRAIAELRCCMVWRDFVRLPDFWSRLLAPF